MGRERSLGSTREMQTVGMIRLLVPSLLLLSRKLGHLLTVLYDNYKDDTERIVPNK
jgi:hypothetical protein